MLTNKFSDVSKLTDSQTGNSLNVSLNQAIKLAYRKGNNAGGSALMLDQIDLQHTGQLESFK